ncbi:MAG: hypothetical protein RJS97_08845 [Parvibaculaceae bacterium]
MTELKPFQRATVQAVLAAFDRRRKTRRFLVADEVGLGKTVVAQHVTEYEHPSAALRADSSGAVGIQSAKPRFLVTGGGKLRIFVNPCKKTARAVSNRCRHARP